MIKTTICPRCHVDIDTSKPRDPLACQDKLCPMKSEGEKK